MAKIKGKDKDVTILTIDDSDYIAASFPMFATMEKFFHTERFIRNLYL